MIGIIPGPLLARQQGMGIGLHDCAVTMSNLMTIQYDGYEIWLMVIIWLIILLILMMVNNTYNNLVGG